MVDLAIIATRPDRDAFLTTFQDLLEQVDLGGFSSRNILDQTEDEDFTAWVRAKFGNAWNIAHAAALPEVDYPRAQLIIEAGAQPGKLP